MAEAARYEEQLARLVNLAGKPKSPAVCAEMRNLLPRGAETPHPNTVSDWVALRTVPRDDGQLELLLTALQNLARARQNRPGLRFAPAGDWHAWAGRAREQRKANARPSAPHRSPLTSVPTWRRNVAGSPVWQLLAVDRAGASDALLDQSQQLADLLEELYADARHALDDDPWHDEHLARRISRRTNQLVLLLWRGREGFLDPAEAALIALLPFLYQTHRARTAVELSHIDPTDLSHRSAPHPERRMYEKLLRAHERLVRRAELGGLADRRDDGRPLIGWWLFHQWAGRQPGRLTDLLSAVEADGSGLDDIAAVLAPDLLSRLLHCAHAGPAELYDRARPDHLREDPFPLDFHGQDFQDVRERLVGSLFAVAHALAIEATTLPSVIVRHVGIPEALDPGALLGTLENASWLPRRDGVGLRAGCRHPAVVAALDEHAERVESLLRAVRRSGPAEFAALPLYTWADEVREVDETGEPVPVEGVIRFRLDEERVQELLMGENLYRDRSLAIRELYQNALDACRYRRARSRAADPYSEYKGRITFTQGYDEVEGRHYLECRDNGVGMDELTLSEVFSQAGVRFTDLPRYREESQEWQDSGVALHPNSRFGIGVLSYFMLADEVRVTTCHMDRIDGRLTELGVLITGPGHYFRVRPTGRPGTIGTTVRLYLRDGDKAPSCVREMRRFLGIAEFTTTAAYEGRPPVTWEPGVMQTREPMAFQPNGFAAHGTTASWKSGPQGEDGQVVWCANGGGVLVDGIHAEPRAKQGILSSPDESPRLRGVVVNLAGATRPLNLSVDRAEILDPDLHRVVEQLIRKALPTLISAEPPILTHEWLSSVANHSLRLADIVTEAAGAAGYALDIRGTSSAMSVAGFFPADASLIGEDAPFDGYTRGVADGATALWRLLSHRPHATLAALTELVPELSRVESVLPARPSDYFARTEIQRGGHWQERGWVTDREHTDLTHPGHALLLAGMCGCSYQEILARMAVLRLPTPPAPDGTPSADEIDLALVAVSSFSPERTVPPGHLLKAHLEFGISIDEAAQRMRMYGLRLPEQDSSPGDADELTLRLLSTNLNGEAPWLDIDRDVLPAHLYRAHTALGVGVREAVRRISAFGFTVTGTQAIPDEPAESTVLLFRALGGFLTYTKSASVPRVLDAAIEVKRPVTEVVQTLRAHDLLVEITPALELLPLEVLADSAAWGMSTTDWAEFADGTVAPGLLARVAARRSGGSVEDTARFFGDLGFDISPVLPRTVAHSDETILSRDIDERTPWLRTGDLVPLLHVVRASVHTGVPTTEVAARLRAYGLVPPDMPLPPASRPDGSFRVDSYVRDLSAGYDGPLSTSESVPLHYLLYIASQVSTDPGSVADSLAAYGFRVDRDRLSRLGEADRVFVQNLTMQGVHLNQPLTDFTDFTDIVGSSGLPAREVIRLLDRLDVNVESVRDAVLAALPYVPGLVVMEPEGTNPSGEDVSP
ncbi:hypothetical protein [Streptomyces sp. Root1310]|uniref:wHTH domain-containing protein n=1 Tax=Streptomyces sp. Root1310 TaxID=1736452 RepID=UPI00070F5EB0|nr:hypothetical protein [Streptomyces sp. Root1310]KQX80674.1 hypothetical protein ASD48_32060 [Streptomyces sp. Root1310]